VIRGEGARLGEEAAHRLARTGRCEIGPGLSDQEFGLIEAEYGFVFADDHRAFLAVGLPLNGAAAEGRTGADLWPDWRNGDPGGVRERLGWPVEGVLFDVEHNGFWQSSWGRRPGGVGDAVSTARRRLAGAPTMVPVYGHRYLPAGQGSYGHPVLSIYQTDIIVYGTDLADYIDNEFGGSGWAISPEWRPPAMVACWSEFL
jgi:hypothetical protein